MSTVQHLMAGIRADVPELDPTEAWQRLQAGALLVDVREENEWALGRPAGALGVPRSHVEFQIGQVAPERDRELLLICAGGARSLLVADSLRRMGYGRVASVAGGFHLWRARGLPVLEDERLDENERERYDRHLRLPEIGVEGQRRLLDSRVLLVGAGGLGSPSALYLAAAGVGTLALIDDDHVERSNLQRQVLHDDDSIGQAKVQSAARRLAAMNPGIEVRQIRQRLEDDNASAVLEGYDVVIDGADNFATRYRVNAACLELGIPWVYGAVQRFQGQASVFVPGQGPCYRCLFPEPPPPEFAPSCSEAGVLGVLPGLIGLIQATEAIKLLLGLGTPLTGRILTYDALAMRFGEIGLPRDPHCPGCGRE
ncbi:MAG: molybdopterin-synthase adenylyltransferase MoeB [Xanthomonadales bacterium]|nr:molybdopterin-synthase adenylyltransferase MoeB [Xanthomonadales bacterium]